MLNIAEEDKLINDLETFGLLFEAMVERDLKMIDEAAKNLLKLKQEIEKENGKVPSVLCVVCGLSNAAYKRPDGVYVVPITALKP